MLSASLNETFPSFLPFYLRLPVDWFTGAAVRHHIQVTAATRCRHRPRSRKQLKNIQVRSGQVRSECFMCTFRASCCSARLSRAQAPAFAGFLCPGQEKWKQVRSGQVRVFNVHIQSKPVMGTGTSLRRFLCLGQEKWKVRSGQVRVFNVHIQNKLL